ncbi:MAG: hypothetical protein IPK17_06235 [Chloroflexi bacterium]|uniref:hypothetical protein n=1 Tax=Candidatus Flexifilum breve TaxID=3140694 RepID=UPI003136A60C|nr:hypothetical protein [Chloroflexota bacterium]
MLHTERDMLLLEQRKQELLRKARIQQLFKEIERETMGDRLLNLLADLMINGGQRLKARAKGGQLTVRRAYKP